MDLLYKVRLLREIGQSHFDEVSLKLYAKSRKKIISFISRQVSSKEINGGLADRDEYIDIGIDESGWTEICWINECGDTGRTHIDNFNVKHTTNLSDEGIVNIIRNLDDKEKGDFFLKYKRIIEKYLIKADFS